MTTPKHLEPLLDGTPLAIERIKLAWSGLSTSDRIYLLSRLLRNSERRPWHEWDFLEDLALADGNAYIRYLAAKKVSTPYKTNAGETPRYLEDKMRFEKVQSDPELLVRFANNEQGGMKEIDDEPELFWKRPRIERLVLVNDIYESGEKIADLLRYATKALLTTNAVSIDEMCDVLVQYLGGLGITERIRRWSSLKIDSYEADIAKHTSVTALWNVIPDLPKGLSYVLIECLPQESYIPPQVIESLDQDQLEILLRRDDIDLKELRRKIYKESTNDSLRNAVLSSQRFVLLDADIAELIYDPKEPKESGRKKMGGLTKLATYCRGATLVQMQAICDLIRNAPFGDWDAIDFGEMEMTARAKRLSPAALKREVLEMRLFELARRVAPIKIDETPQKLPSKLVEHIDLIVSYNPWQTYLNLKKVVRLDSWRQTICHLPTVSISDFDLQDYLDEDSDQDDDQNRRQLFDLLETVQDRVKEVPDKDRAELSALGKALLTISNQMQKVETLTGQRFEVLQTRIEKLASKTNILFWIVGSLLLLALFKMR